MSICTGDCITIIIVVNSPNDYSLHVAIHYSDMLLDY